MERFRGGVTLILQEKFFCQPDSCANRVSAPELLRLNQFAKNLGIVNGSKIELQLLDESIVIKPVKNKPRLEDLLAKAKGKTNPHLDYDFGDPEGKESI